MSAERIRVLHVFGSMERGGAETRTLEIMRRLDRRRWTFDFCVLSGLPGAYAPEIARLGGRVVPCPLRQALPSFPRLLRDGDYDVVHSHVHHFSGAILAAAHVAGVPRRIAHIRTQHDGKPTTAMRTAYRRAMRGLIDLAASRVIGVSECTMDAFWGDGWRHDPRKSVVYNGVEPPATPPGAMRASVRAELGLAPATRLLLHVGTFVPPKNHRALLDAMACIVRRDPDVVLALAGDGPLRADAEAQATALGLGDAVRFLGTRDDVPRLLGGADLFVFPSRWEGLPGAVLEALAAGLPVVASPIAPIAEIARQARGITMADPLEPTAFAAAVLARLASADGAPALPPQFTTAVAMHRLLECYV